MVENTEPGSRPTCSITSISPEAGQPTVGKFAPSSQNAGHSPAVAHTLIPGAPRPAVPVGQADLPGGVDPPGGVLARAARAGRAGGGLPPGLDHQVAGAVGEGVAVGRVELQLVVLPAAGSRRSTARSTGWCRPRR